jgi:hypothetical protein
MSDTKLQIQEVQITQRKQSKSKQIQNPIPRHTSFKLQKIKNKLKTLKEVTEKERP